MLDVVMLEGSYSVCHYADCCYAEYCYAECYLIMRGGEHYAEFYCAECHFMLRAIMLNVFFMQNVVMWNVAFSLLC